jgi:hypothetical protein
MELCKKTINLFAFSSPIDRHRSYRSLTKQSKKILSISKNRFDAVLRLVATLRIFERERERESRDFNMVLYNFKKIQPVPNANDFIDIVLTRTQRKTPTVRSLTLHFFISFEKFENIVKSTVYISLHHFIKSLYLIWLEYIYSFIQSYIDMCSEYDILSLFTLHFFYSSKMS